MVELLTIVAAGSILAFLFAVKVFFDLQKSMGGDVRRLEERLASLEHTAMGVGSDVAALRSSMQDKVDRDYLQKRMDGLVDLMKSKKR